LAAAERSFPADHPAAQGHFPGNPVIPGAVLLSAALPAIEEGLGVSLSSWRLRSAKFLAPARPGDRVRIEFTRSADGTIRFACTAGQRTLVKGELQCDTGPAEA
jgi:3-hydroxymyristoyl/3-hydroxydecanoyl-(acyl carrier protein) dehydratase